MSPNAVVFSLVTALLTTVSCDLEPRPKARDKASPPAAADTVGAAKAAAQPPSAPPANAQPSAAAAAAADVRAPTHSDLVRYTRGLKGKGRLMARIDTSMGAIDCELEAGKAPLAVANFVGLARGLHPWLDPKTKKVERKPYFDGLIFHRVIPNFMIQAGDPLGLGTGGPGYTFPLEAHPELKHVAGALSMAHPARNQDGNGSQFFITERQAQALDGKYTVFGRCNNLDVVQKIARAEKDPSDRTRSRPKNPTTITKVSIYLGPGVPLPVPVPALPQPEAAGKPGQVAPAGGQPRRPSPRRPAPRRAPQPR